MKLGFALITGLIMVHGQFAYATRARLTGLGQDKNGSLFIQDDRNTFLNPAHVTQVPNRINLEAGQTDRVTAGATNDPKAEGGIVYQLNSLSLGAQLGRVSKAADQIQNQTSLTAVDYYDPQNSVELIVGGKGSLAWGGSLHYARSESDTTAMADFPDSEARVVVARGGVKADRFQGYLALDAIHESDTTTSSGVTQKYKGDLSWEVGGSFDLSQTQAVGAYVQQSSYDFDDAAAVKGDHKVLRGSATFFNYFKKEDKVMIFGLAGLFYEDGKSDYEVSGATDKTKEYLQLPVGLGFEAGMTSWLNLRGSVTQNVLIDKDESSDGSAAAANNKKIDGEDDTTVTVGASVIFEKLALDATLEGTGNAGNGKINGNQLLANVGLTYDF